jgi:YesN/AraC family two-component response regulator
MAKMEGISKVAPERQQYYYNAMAKLLYQGNQLEEALSYASKSLGLINVGRDSAILFESWRINAVLQNRLGRIDGSLELAKQMYGFARKANNPQWVRVALMLMGNASNQYKLYQDALKFYTEVLDLSESLRDSAALAVDHYNIGLTYSFLKSYDKARERYEIAIPLAEKVNNLRLLATVYGSSADLMSILQKHPEQAAYLVKANAIASQIGDYVLLATGKASLMDAYMDQKKYREALQAGESALKILQANPMISIETQILEKMYRAYKGLGDFKTAIAYLERYQSKKTEFEQRSHQEKLAELSVQFDLEKKNLQIQQQKTALLAEQRKKSTNRLIAVLFGMLSLFVGGAYWRERTFRTRLYQKEKESDQQIVTYKERLEVLGGLRPKSISIQPLLPGTEDEVLPADLPLRSNDDKIHKLFVEAIAVIEQEKLYLRPDIDQQYIIKILGTNKAYLSKAILAHGDTNFKGIINRLRINEAKRLIHWYIIEKKNLNFDQILEDSGFNSKATFYRLFKFHTGLTPNDYAYHLRKDIAE